MHPPMHNTRCTRWVAIGATRNVRQARVSATIARADNTIARHSPAFKSAAVNYAGYDYRRVLVSSLPARRRGVECGRERFAWHRVQKLCQP